MKTTAIKVFHLTFFFFICQLQVSAQIGVINPEVDRRIAPRVKSNNNATGHYEMVLLLEKNEIESGNSLKVLVSFTGYGNIKQAKIYVSPSSKIFDSQNSYAIHSIDPKTYQWGAVKNSIASKGFGFALKGYRASTWADKEPTMFLYATNDTLKNTIRTEYILGNAPLTFVFKSKDDINGTLYKHSFYLLQWF